MRSSKLRWWVMFPMIAAFVCTTFMAAMGQEGLEVFKKAKIDWT